MIITPEGWYEVPITSEMYANANAKAIDLGVRRNSIREGEGNLAGFLGEEVAAAALSATSTNTYQHDLTLRIDDLEVTFEVKTKDRTVYPRIYFEASVANFNTKQRADYYLFVSVFRDHTNIYRVGHVMGFISKDDYFRKARFIPKEYIDVNSSNKIKFKADCYNVPYSELYNFSSLRMAE